MIPISLSWDSEKRLVALKGNGLFSSGLKNGKVFINILGIPLPAMVEAFFGKIPDMLEKAVNIVKGKKKGEGSGAKE